MDKLFEHIEGNHFKLNEDIDGSISKMEEDMGLNYIRKVLIPMAVNSWNKGCLKSKTSKDCMITVELVSKNLKKVFHAKRSKNDKTTADAIKYESNFLLPPEGGFKLRESFIFELYKHVQNGRLMAEFMIPGSDYRTYFVGDKID